MTNLCAFAPNPAYKQITIDCVQESCLTAIHTALQMATGRALLPFDRLHLSRKAASLAGVTPDALMAPKRYLEAAKRFGVCPIGTPAADEDRVALDYRIADWTEYSTGWLTEYTGIVDAALAKDEPVVIAFAINTSNVNAPDWTLALMTPSNDAHSVCVLHNNDKTLPYDFENTWGDGWGRHGFGTLARDLFVKWHSGNSGIQSCRAARPVSVPVTPLTKPTEVAVTTNEILAALKAKHWTQAERDAFVAAIVVDAAPPVVTPPVQPSGSVTRGPRITAADGSVFALDGASVNRGKARVGVDGRYIIELARDGSQIKALEAHTGQWFLYPDWTATSAPT